MIGGERIQTQRRGEAEAERCSDGGRRRGELGQGRKLDDLGAAPGERAEGEDRLDRRDASAGNYHAVSAVL
jgi:hypothetical protein